MDPLFYPVARAEGFAPDGRVVEVEFRVSDTRYPLAALSEETGCRAELVQTLPRSDDSFTVFQRITGAPPERILEFTENYEGYDARVVSEDDESAIVEFRIGGSGKFFVVTLTDAGAIPTQLASEDGVATIVAEIPPGYSASDVIERFREAYPTGEVVARRQKEYPASLFQRREFQHVVADLLTPRQHEVLLLAYTRGYYDWPREQSGEELAEELGVTPATFFQHLRIAQRKLLSLLFNP